MANGFGSLYVGQSGMQTAQNGLNVIGNNLTNVNTTGYVRQQVVYADTGYNPTQQWAAIGKQQVGLGVSIGDVVHARDVFLDQSYRTQNSRQTFYEANYDAAYEVETFLQELDGADFKTAMSDLYEAFAEFAKYPDDSANQNLVVQKSELFIQRAQAVYAGLQEYQSTINTKIKNDVTRINELSSTINQLNKDIQRIEAANVETASALRDQRDLALDELSGLASITYTEQYNGVVTVKLEGQDFITEARAMPIALRRDAATGFVTPYWPHLSDTNNEDYYDVFDLSRISADYNNDKGEVKGLLLARGDHFATYKDLQSVDSFDYQNGVGNSVMMNSQAEMDLLIHSIVTAVNDIICPNDTAGNLLKDASGSNLVTFPITTDYNGKPIKDENGREIKITADTLILDEENSSVGSDNVRPPQELFTRTGVSRYTEANIKLDDGTTKKVYIFNEERDDDTSTQYTMNSMRINEKLVADQSLLAHRTIKNNENQVDFSMSEKFENMWNKGGYTLNPADQNEVTLMNFYAKMVGELGTNANIFKATAESYESTVNAIDANRQQVFGVSSDEELTNMIKYQNAYNASSRYINVVNSMIDQLLSSV